MLPSRARGLLAVPVLAGSAAYCVAEAFKWRASLQRKPHQAIRFYSVLAAAMLIGLALNLVKIDPIRALFWSAIANGVVAVPMMVVMMKLVTNKNVGASHHSRCIKSNRMGCYHSDAFSFHRHVCHASALTSGLSHWRSSTSIATRGRSTAPRICGHRNL